ncbi:hypothetical protein MNBD_GAMMA16-2277 [hydrothermal vent metagenome]|uniref:ATP synthase protein I n=1 Tax=hydrothermal vent metagenome TaxID=652676 RepID=A0A3B1A0T6_9ZZZZ
MGGLYFGLNFRDTLNDMSKPDGAGWLLIGVGTQLAAMVVTGFMLGYGADYLLNTQPIFMLIFGVLGFIGGVLSAMKLLIRLG